MCSCCVLFEGVHLEGPFISREKKGAHDDSLILPSLAGGMDEVRQVYGSLDNAAIVTLAPELPGAIDVIRQLTSLGIVVSLGDLTRDNFVCSFTIVKDKCSGGWISTQRSAEDEPFL